MRVCRKKRCVDVMPIKYLSDARSCVHVCSCVCIYAYVLMRVCLCMCMCASIHVFMCSCVPVCVCACACACVYVYGRSHPSLITTDTRVIGLVG